MQNELTIYATNGAVSTADVSWKPVASTADGVTGYDVKGSTIYVLTHKAAPTFKVVATSLDAPNLAAAKTVVAAGTPIVEQIGVADDGLYVLARDGGFGQITRIALAGDGTPGATTKRDASVCRLDQLDLAPMRAKPAPSSG